MNHNESFEQRWSRLVHEASSVTAGRGTRPVSPQAWERASGLLHILRTEAQFTQAPHVSYSDSGSVYLRWGNAPGFVITVEIDTDGPMIWEQDGPDGFDSGEDEGREIMSRIRALAYAHAL